MSRHNFPELKASVLGFSGTRRGMTSPQKAALRRLIRAAPLLAFHHGDCVGADAEAHDIVSTANPKARIFIHPPTDDKMRAYCMGAHVVLTPLPYLERNHAIVDASDLVVAMPGEMEEEVRSGTWATVRYAKKVGKPLAIILPDGSRA